LEIHKPSTQINFPAKDKYVLGIVKRFREAGKRLSQGWAKEVRPTRIARAIFFGAAAYLSKIADSICGLLIGPCGYCGACLWAEYKGIGLW
jgi:hypothetical protein